MSNHEPVQPIGEFMDNLRDVIQTHFYRNGQFINKWPCPYCGGQIVMNAMHVPNTIEGLTKPVIMICLPCGTVLRLFEGLCRYATAEEVDSAGHRETLRELEAKRGTKFVVRSAGEMRRN